MKKVLEVCGRDVQPKLVMLSEEDHIGGLTINSANTYGEIFSNIAAVF